MTQEEFRISKLRMRYRFHIYSSQMTCWFYVGQIRIPCKESMSYLKIRPITLDLNINRSKSRIFFRKRVQGEKGTHFNMGISESVLPIRYLGLPLTIQYPKAVHFLSLIDKLRAKIEGWMLHNPSFAGRLEPIKSVLYWTKSYRYPASINREVERICASFLRKSKLHTLSWKDTCRAKKGGGTWPQESG